MTKNLQEPIANAAISGVFKLTSNGTILDHQGGIDRSHYAYIDWSDQHIEKIFPGLLEKLLLKLEKTQGLRTSSSIYMCSPIAESKNQHYDLSAQSLIDNSYQLLVLLDDADRVALWQPMQRRDVINKALYDSSLDALITIDSNSEICAFSRSAESIFGYRCEDVLGRPVTEVIIPPSMRQAHDDGMKNYLASGHGPVLNTRIEVEALRSNGETFPCELTVVPADEVDGERFFTATLRDITDRKEHEFQLQKALEDAEQSSHAKSSFLAQMSHEIRSPLNAIIGALELMNDTPRPAEEALLVQSAVGASHSLISIIDDVLNFSRIVTGNYQCRSEPFNLHLLCEQAIDIVSITATQKSLPLYLYIAPAVPVTSTGDASALRQVLINLLDNAVKYSKSGIIILSVSTKDNNLQFTVEDQGIGIAEKDLANIFDEFSRLESRARTQPAGSGLGLAICQRLVSKLGGDIHVSSQLNQGSRFTIDLPMTQAPTPFEQIPETTLQHNTLRLISTNHLLTSALNLQANDLGYSMTTQEGLPAADAINKNEIILLDILSPIDKSTLQALTASCVDAAGIILLTIGSNQQHIQPTPDSIALTPPLTKLRLQQSLQKLSQTFDNGKKLQPGQQQSAAVSNQLQGRVLLVEDNTANQIIAKSMMLRLGVQLDIVDDGEKAVAAVQQQPYDLILMDVRMPIMDGLEATRKIRELGVDINTLPIIAMTANAFAEDVEACLQAGMDDFIAKPVDRNILYEKLQFWLLKKNY